MLVTRQSSLTGETNELTAAPVSGPDGPRSHWYPRPVTKTQLVGFCDWLSIYQRHGPGLPKVADGAVIRVDREGEVVTTTLKKVRVEGSHESSVFIRCDGETVWFEGNVSKFGRTDNVFGYSFQQCLLRVNALLSEFGLPAFTAGESFVTNFKSEPRTLWTGAIVTRVDVTQNYATGGKEDAYHFMRFLQAQQANRLKTGTYGDGETVDFGRGSRYAYFKAYLKATELRKHARASAVADDEFGMERSEYLERVADWCDDIGLVRVELTFKATKLHDMGCHFLGGFDMKQLEIEFERYSEVMTRASAEVEDLGSLPKAVLATFRMWQAGDDITSKLSRATFYRHRRELLPYGVDIAVKSNVTALKTKTRVVRLGPVSPPDWYQLPELERKRYGTHG